MNKSLESVSGIIDIEAISLLERDSGAYSQKTYQPYMPWTLARMATDENSGFYPNMQAGSLGEMMEGAVEDATKPQFVADDASFIAKRLKEIKAEREKAIKGEASSFENQPWTAEQVEKLKRIFES